MQTACRRKPLNRHGGRSMGSIRPLVTITILAVVGAYLYVKINEGPAPTRAGAANSLSHSPWGVPRWTGTKGTSLAAEGGAPTWPSTAAPATPTSPSATPAAASVNSLTESTTNSTEKTPAATAT